MDRLSVLQQQNQKLAANLDEKRRECKQLETKVQEYEGLQDDYRRTMLCVRRLWDQLNDDIKLLASKVGSTAGTNMDVDNEAGESKALQAITAADPFLGRLVAGAASSSSLNSVHSIIKKGVPNVSELKEVEKTLQAQGNTTKEALAKVLDAIRAQTVSTSDSALQQQLDGIECERRVLKDQCKQLSDQLLLAQKEIKTLNEEVADAQNAVSVSNRKLTTTADALKQAKAELERLKEEVAAAPPSTTAQGSSDRAGAAAGGGSGIVKKEEDQATAAATAGGGEAAAAAVPAEDAPVLDEAVTELIKQRTAELEAELEAHMNTKRELAEARSYLLDDSKWVTSTNTYKALQQQLAAAHEARLALLRDLEALQADKEAAEARAADRNILAQRSSDLATKLKEMTEHASHLANSKAEADSGRLGAEAALAAERAAAAGSSSSAAELQALLDDMKRQLEFKEQQLKQAQVPAAMVSSATAEVAASRAAVAAARIAASAAVAKARELEVSLSSSAGAAREEAYQDRIADLQAFVEVLTTYSGSGDSSSVKETCEAKAQVVGLTAKVNRLQAKLDAAAAGNKDLATAKTAERCAVEAAEAAAQQVALLQGQLQAAQAQIGDLDKQLGVARSDAELYLREVEASAVAIEDLRAADLRLAQLLTDKDKKAAALAAEKLQLSAHSTKLEEAYEMMRSEVERLGREVVEAQQARDALEREWTRLNTELSQAKDALRQEVLRVSLVAADLAKTQQERAAAETRLSEAQSSCQSLRDQLLEEGERAAREKAKRQRLEEDNKMLSTKFTKLRRAAALGSTGGGKELFEEMEAMRKLLTCNVCHERYKNAIITKCCHLFCEVCINKNLQSRHRKCPGCGVPFGQADVKSVFLT